MDVYSEQSEKLTTINIGQLNQQPIDLTFRNLTYKVPYKRKKEEKIILKDVSGAFYSGKLSAILGPSGAGKTSLLKILAGCNKRGIIGKIFTNGHERNLDEFQWQSSYIAQESSLIASLTVSETLNVAAELKLSQKTSKEEKKEIITDIASLLNLQKSINTKVNSLSGGEIKRLSIGIELVTQPSIMFFDEPTSGLDSVSSSQVISHLRTLANKGHTIVCVIHQPSSQLFNMFDDLMIMSNGKSIYNGSLNDMVDVFEKAGYKYPPFYNRADFAIDVASNKLEGNIESLIMKSTYQNDNIENTIGEISNEKVSRFTRISSSNNSHYNIVSSDDSENISGPKNHWLRKGNKGKYAVSTMKQFCVLLKRSMLSSFRDIQLAYMRVSAHIIVGIILGLIYYNIGNDAHKITSNASLLFFYIMFIFFSNAMPTVLTFPQEAAVFEREHQNNWYSVSSYFFSKIMADFPLQILCPTIFIISSYYMTDQPSDSFRVCMVWITCILFAIIAQTMGLIMGVIFSVQMGIFSVPAMTIPMLIFSGFFLKFDEVPVYFKPFSYLSYFGYGFEALLLAIYDYDRKPLDCSVDFCYFKSPTKFLDNMTVKRGNFNNDLLVLIGIVIILQIILYVALIIRTWKSK